MRTAFSIPKQPQVATVLDGPARSAPRAPDLVESLEELTTQARPNAAGQRGHASARWQIGWARKP